MEAETIKTTSLSYIESQISKSISAFESSSNWYRRRFYVASLSASILSAFITVIAGWSNKIDLTVIDSNDVILVLGAITTVITVWGAFFSPKETWLMYAENLNKFRALSAKIDFLKNSPAGLSEEQTQELFNEYQYIHDSANSTWLNLRNTHNK